MKFISILFITFQFTIFHFLNQEIYSNSRVLAQRIREKESNINYEKKRFNKDNNDLNNKIYDEDNHVYLRKLGLISSNFCQIRNPTTYSILPSVNGRYTMEFWVKLTANPNFVNIIWGKLMKIEIVKTSDNDSSFNCYPQYYVELNSQNKNNFPVSFDQKWIFIRCAYNWDNEIYYFSRNNIKVTETRIIKDTIYGNKTFDYPLKYFFHDSEQTELQINFTSGFIIRTLYLYNEYLPQEYDTSRLKLIDFSINLQHLIFGVDYEIVNNTILILNRVTSQLVERANLSSCNVGNYDIPILCEANLVNVYQVFNKVTKLCERQENCLVPNSKIKYGCNAIECEMGFYLDYHQQPFQCLTNCPYGWSRSPGSNIDSALCNYFVDAKHLPISTFRDFPNNLKCNSGYARVGYKCVLKENQRKSKIS